MQYLKQGLILSILILAINLVSCKKETPIHHNDYDDGIDHGEEIVIDEDNVTETLNVRGGELEIHGNTKVESDINITDEESVVVVSDDVELHHVNLDKGEIHMMGSSSIDNDLNVHEGGTVYIGHEDSEITDTVWIGGNFNISDTLWIEGGVLVIEHDLNQNSGLINIEIGAKLIVRNHFNQSGDVYGTENLDVIVKHNHNHGQRVATPYSVDNE